MTDEQLDRMMRDADPYRPTVARSLDGADNDLLEEIMSQAPPVRKRRRLIWAGVAAAAIAGAFALSTTTHEAPAKEPATYSALVLKAAEDNPRLLIDEPGWKATTVYGFTADQGTIAFTKGSRSLDMNWYPNSL